MKQVLVSKLHKLRPKGRPRQCWLNRIKGDLNQVVEMARMEDTDNRERWKNLIWK